MKEKRYLVHSENGKSYIVSSNNKKWSCSCPDFKYRGETKENFVCKHIIKVKVEENMKKMTMRQRDMVEMLFYHYRQYLRNEGDWELKTSRFNVKQASEYIGYLKAKIRKGQNDKKYKNS